MFRVAPMQNPARGRKAQEIAFPAPTGGWITNRNLAMPNGQNMPQGAEVLENYFPTASGAVLRRGSRTYAELGQDNEPVTTMFKYVVGNNRKLFASTSSTVYDITSITQAYNISIGVQDEWTLALDEDEESDTIGENSTVGNEVIEDAGSGNWSTVQFATTGGTFLLGVNGASVGFIYDGADFHLIEGDEDELFPGITFPDGSTLTSADLSYVWAYKNRLWFLQKESMTAWYLPVDQIGGELTPLRLGSEFGRGGALIIGQTWSLEGGAEGGLSEQVVFITNEGEVAVYQGSNPADSADWRKVGVYRIGIPLGSKALIRAGGDLLIATTLGLVALSQAIQVDFAALASTAVSYPIDVPWNEAIRTRGQSGWSCALWAEQQMAIVSPPILSGYASDVFVSNARTGAWCRFTNWPITCIETFNGRLLFGTKDGFIKDAMVGGTDDGTPFTGSYIPLFSDGGSPTSMKTAKLARATIRSAAQVNVKLSCRFDFNTNLPAPPSVEPIPPGNEWNNAEWNQSLWDSGRAAIVSQQRYSVSGSGQRVAPVLQITSGSTVPLDAEIVALAVTCEVGEIFT